VEFIVEDTFPGLASDKALLSRRSVYLFKSIRQPPDDRRCNVSTTGEKVAYTPNTVALHSRSWCQDLPLFFLELQYSSINRIGETFASVSKFDVVCNGSIHAFLLPESRGQVVLFVTRADLSTGVLIDEGSMSLAILESLDELVIFFTVKRQWVSKCNCAQVAKHTPHLGFVLTLYIAGRC